MRFSYSDSCFEPAPVGVYLAQVTKAIQTTSKSSGHPMLTLTLRTTPDGYFLRYYLVFNGKKESDGLITQFCKNCEGELRSPEDGEIELSLTPADALHRVVFVDVEHETVQGWDEPQAKIKLGGILSRAKALARNPELAKVKLPTNVPPAQDLAILPKGGEPLKPSTGALPPPDDDIPF